MGKGSKRRPGVMPADSPIWKGHKPAYLKSEDELCSGRFVMVDGELVPGHVRVDDVSLMTSVTFGRHRGEQAAELERLHKNGITEAIGYDAGGALLFSGGYQAQKKIAKFYGDGMLGID
ncbi:hypothetical protein DRO91_05850 [Candidatus Heimdallarchaeota archaeon]|nr:MAG: hypothetical protein DRO91_05850 [Candidatus Heimdallarchaeota archaeon]